MFSGLADARAGLKVCPTVAPRPAPQLPLDLTPAEEAATRRQFFASGVGHWYPSVAELTFPTEVLSLAGPYLGADLAERVDAVLSAKGWSHAFVKLSTRSAKDAPSILASAATEVTAGDAEERLTQLSRAVQRRLCVQSGGEAVALLEASARVAEDLAYAAEEPAATFPALGLAVVVREWAAPVPIEREFRGIVWDGELYAVGQYFHPLYFPELAGVKEAVAHDLQDFFRSVQGKLSAFPFCILDLAWNGPGDVVLIELNPFDGVALGCFPASTGLFRWDEPADQHRIKHGPFELRLREARQSDEVLRLGIGTAWRDIVFPRRAR